MARLEVTGFTVLPFLAERRVDCGLSVSKLALEAGVSRHTVAKIEAGEAARNYLCRKILDVLERAAPSAKRKDFDFLSAEDALEETIVQAFYRRMRFYDNKFDRAADREERERIERERVIELREVDGLINKFMGNSLMKEYRERPDPLTKMAIEQNLQKK